MIIRCSCRSSFWSLLHFHAQNSRHISRPPRRVRGKKRGKPLIYIAPYVLGASRSSRSDLARLRLASSRSGFVRPLFGAVRLCLEYWQGSRRRPRVCSCGWCPAWPALRRSCWPWCKPCPPWPFPWPLAALWVAAGVVPWPRPLARAGGPFAGLVAWWLVVVCPCPLRGPHGRRVAGAGVVLIYCAWSLPPLRFGPLQPPPLRLLVHISSAPAAVGPWRAAGGVALVAWSDCQRTSADYVAGVVAVLWWPWRVSNPRRRCGALQWSRPWPLRAVVFSLLWRCTP